MSRSSWSLREAPPIKGETWLITGATSGLGLSTARAAAAHGARVILAVRNLERGRLLAAELGNAEVIHLELSDLSSVRRAAESVGEVDVLINNAGSSTMSRRETSDGFEWHLGVNLLAPFLFTNLVLDRVKRRIVVVVSVMHRFGSIDFADPHFRHRKWSTVSAYSQSKLGDVLWAHELSDRLAAAGSSVDVQMAHPGWANTAVGNPTRTKLGKSVVRVAGKVLANPTDIASLTTQFAAAEELAPASLIGPAGFGQLRGFPTLVEQSPKVFNQALTRRLWDFAASETS